MNRRFWSTLVVFALCSAGTLGGAQLAGSQDQSVRVLSVVDGDTVNVSVGGQRQRVILYGMDCPELGQDFGQEARNFTDSCAYKKDVKLDVRGKDSRGRTIAVVYLADGTNLNQELVKRGLAWWSDKYAPNDTVMKGLQDSAKAGQIGLWSQPNPVPPWIWRNGQKNVQATIKKPE